MNEKHDEIIIVLLRRPRNEDDEQRDDPFWEFGSFGCTRCHSKNLMNPKNTDHLQGKRLAFAQGGGQGFKLVFLSPPITINPHNGFIEARWKPKLMPFRYTKAPLLIDKSGDTEFPAIKSEVTSINRSTWEGRFSSAFRSRKNPVSESIARKMVEVFDNRVKQSDPGDFASSYEEAMLDPPPKIDRNRQATYRRYLGLPATSCGKQK